MSGTIQEVVAEIYGERLKCEHHQLMNAIDVLGKMYVTDLPGMSLEMLNTIITSEYPTETVLDQLYAELFP